MKKKKTSNKNKTKRIFILLILVLIAIVALYFIFFYKGIDTSEVKKEYKPKTTKEIPEYGYALTEDKTKLFKDKFNDLVKILEAETVDNEAYAKKITELFIIDLYSLDNKKTSSDIGGIQFVYQPFQQDFIKIVHTTLYDYMQSNIDGKRKQELPNVTSVNIEDIQPEQFHIDSTKTNVDGYKVDITWEYNKDLGYQTSSSVNVIFETDKKLAIAEITDK